MSDTHAAAGRKGAKKSPWAKGPAANTTAAALSYLRYVKRGKRQAKATTMALLAWALLACLLLTACGQPACDPHPGYRPDGQQCS